MTRPALSCACRRHPLFCIIPPYMLDKLASSPDDAVRQAAIEAIASAADARATRRVLREMPTMAAFAAPTAGKHRLVYDALGKGLSQLPGDLVRSEGDPAGPNPAVNEAYDHAGTTYDFFFGQFARRSLDGRGMTLISSINVGRNLNNAFWTGRQMAYGEGDGRTFFRFTKSLDVVGHELTHGVISFECNLRYYGESGALNEHFADVFGILVRQWQANQSAAAADWLVGKDIIGPGTTTARALRDFGPQRAYENDFLLGTDPQPKHMKDKYTGNEDEGGVHINSGIPNHAFYLFARAVGGYAWEAPGQIWYETMRKLSSNSDFSDMVDATEMITIARHGNGSHVHTALMTAWRQVGL